MFSYALVDIARANLFYICVTVAQVCPSLFAGSSSSGEIPRLDPPYNVGAMTGRVDNRTPATIDPRPSSQSSFSSGSNEASLVSGSYYRLLDETQYQMPNPPTATDFTQRQIVHSGMSSRIEQPSFPGMFSGVDYSSGDSRYHEHQTSLARTQHRRHTQKRKRSVDGSESVRNGEFAASGHTSVVDAPLSQDVSSSGPSESTPPTARKRRRTGAVDSKSGTSSNIIAPRPRSHRSGNFDVQTTPDSGFAPAAASQKRKRTLSCHESESLNEGHGAPQYYYSPRGSPLHAPQGFDRGLAPCVGQWRMQNLSTAHSNGAEEYTSWTRLSPPIHCQPMAPVSQDDTRSLTTSYRDFSPDRLLANAELNGSAPVDYYDVGVQDVSQVHDHYGMGYVAPGLATGDLHQPLRTARSAPRARRHEASTVEKASQRGLPSEKKSGKDTKPVVFLCDWIEDEQTQRRCDEGFARKHDLKRHQESVHLKVRYPCPACVKDFSREDAVRRHLRDACLFRQNLLVADAS